jgi:phosphoribosylaminoimidazole-succinocarboxamide synthase
VSDAVSTPRGPVFFSVIETRDPYVPELEEVRERVREDAIRARASELSRERATQVNQTVTERAAVADLTHLDGKIECLYVDGEVKVADVVGTLDENRFAYAGRQLSKEVIRLLTEDKMKLEAVREMLQQNAIKRKVDLKTLKFEEPSMPRATRASNRQQRPNALPAVMSHDGRSVRGAWSP